LILRCIWLVAIVLSKENHPNLTTFGYATLLAFAELVRRWVWAIIRIENEQVSNLEKYRHILEVPELGSTDAPEKTEEHYNKLVKELIRKKARKRTSSFSSLSN